MAAILPVGTVDTVDTGTVRPEIGGLPDKYIYQSGRVK